MKNTITLDVDHPNKERTQHFLNCIDESLEHVLFDWHSLKKAESILAGYKFRNTAQTLSITLLFAVSYDDANQIADANAFPVLPHARWSLNGNVLYLIESNDANKVDSILSLFSGKE